MSENQDQGKASDWVPEGASGSGGVDKSLLTNLVSAVFIGIGLFLDEPYREPVLNVGLFALSGALTNWLAIHMLFEKVPGFYGSGVIPARFEDFKEGIHQLIMRQFFTIENIRRFFEGEGNGNGKGAGGVDLAPLIDTVDLDPAFEALKTAVMESQFGGMLSMFGGVSALEPLKPKFADKMRAAVKDITGTEEFQHKLQDLLTGGGGGDDHHSELLDRVDVIVEKRLNELTPQMVKDIIQQMIREHLGWLVVWGGVCGGLIGLLAGFLR